MTGSPTGLASTPWGLRLREAWPAASPAARRLLARLVGASEADDLLQDIFERALVAQPPELSGEALSRWLLQIARNAAIDRLRAQVVRDRVANEPLALGPGDAEEASPDVALQRKQVCECIASLVERLPAGQRTVLELAELKGLSDRDAADRLGLSLGSAKIRLHRARRALRAAMREECRTFRDERNELSCEPVRSKPRAP